jgi:hypothetical protein
LSLGFIGQSVLVFVAAPATAAASRSAATLARKTHEENQ